MLPFKIYLKKIYTFYLQLVNPQIKHKTRFQKVYFSFLLKMWHFFNVLSLFNFNKPHHYYYDKIYSILYYN